MTVPEYADQNSTADEREVDRRGVDAPSLPNEREDGPGALEGWGTTPAEARQGTPLDARLAQELPDYADRPPRADEQASSSDVPGLLDDAAAEPTDSEVSMYDTPEDDVSLVRGDSPEESAMRVIPEP